MTQLLNLKRTSIHRNKIQLSETMKDVLKQLCIFEKQLAKHTKKEIWEYFYTSKMIFGIRLNHAIYIIILTSRCLSKLHMYFCTYLVLQLSKN